MLIRLRIVGTSGHRGIIGNVQSQPVLDGGNDGALEKDDFFARLHHSRTPDLALVASIDHRCGNDDLVTDDFEIAANDTVDV